MNTRRSTRSAVANNTTTNSVSSATRSTASSRQRAAATAAKNGASSPAVGSKRKQVTAKAGTENGSSNKRKPNVQNAKEQQKGESSVTATIAKPLDLDSVTVEGWIRARTKQKIAQINEHTEQRVLEFQAQADELKQTLVEKQKETEPSSKGSKAKKGKN